MITVMLSGSITKQPETRQSKNGNSYALASIRVQTVEGDLFANVMAFGDLADTLARLTKGDSVTVIGAAKLSAYTGKDGGAKVGLSVPASRILALVDHQSAPRPKSNRQRRRPADTPVGPSNLPPIEAYNDPIPF